MKLMIASDIHGLAAYCARLMEAYRKEAPDRLLLLGDLLYHGPRNDLPLDYAPKRVIEMLNAVSENLLCVRGNCEAEVDQMVLSVPVLADYAYLEVNGISIFATHGHHYSETTPPPLKKGDVLLCGHTHVSRCARYESFTYLNPGSVSIPKEGTPHSYATLEGNRFAWKTLDGEVYRTELL